jgi:hypothetical protein
MSYVSFATKAAGAAILGAGLLAVSVEPVAACGERPAAPSTRPSSPCDKGGSRPAVREVEPRRAAPCPTKCDPSLNGLPRWMREGIRSSRQTYGR